METKNIGLRNIPIADTKISMIDGEKGKLIYRGFDVLDLTKNSNFEECCFLLLHDHLPNKLEFDEFVSSLKEARKIPEQMQKNMRNWRKNAHPMDVLQAFVAALAGYYDEQGSEKEISQQRAINLISKVPTIIASWERVRNDKEPIQPDPTPPDHPHAAHLGHVLWLLAHEVPERAEGAAHGLVPARVVVACTLELALVEVPDRVHALFH